MIIAVVMRNDVLYVLKMRAKVIPRGRYAIYQVDGATLSRFVELY